MAYEALRARVRRAKKPIELDGLIGVVKLVLGAVEHAAADPRPDKRGVCPVSMDEAESEAARIGAVGEFPFLREGGGWL